MRDVSRAAWVEQRLSKSPWGTVGSLVPDGFDAYVRILHPAYVERDNGTVDAVRWATVASWAGRTVHPHVHFSRIAGLSDHLNEQPSWGRRPREGALDGGDLRRSASSVHVYAG